MSKFCDFQLTSSVPPALNNVLSCGTSAMIRRTVALDSQYIATWMVWINDRHVNSEISNAYLRNNLNPMLPQLFNDGLLKG